LAFLRCEAPYFGLGCEPPGSREVFGRLNPRADRFYCALALTDDGLFASNCRGITTTVACFMRLNRITRTAVSAGEMKPQRERQPEILRSRAPHPHRARSLRRLVHAR